MKCLVTGGAGFIGSHLVDALVATGDEVTVLDNFRRGKREHLKRHLDGNVRIIDGDIRDEAALHDAVDDAEVIFHLAAQSNVLGAVADAEYCLTTNVVGTFNVLNAAASAGTRRVVFTSSREVYGEPDQLPVPETAPLRPKNPYGASKVAGEAYCTAWHAMGRVECAILRLSNVYGSRDRDRVIPLWIGLAMEGKDLPVFGGDQVLDLVPVETVVDALMASRTCHVTGPINVAAGHGTAILELARRLIELAAGDSCLRRLPARRVEVTRFVANVDLMERILGVPRPVDSLANLGPLVSEQARTQGTP
jgi:UDP-glucose 4-epimerase